MYTNFMHLLPGNVCHLAVVAQHLIMMGISLAGSHHDGHRSCRETGSQPSGSPFDLEVTQDDGQVVRPFSTICRAAASVVCSQGLPACRCVHIWHNNQINSTTLQNRVTGTTLQPCGASMLFAEGTEACQGCTSNDQ